MTTIEFLANKRLKYSVIAHQDTYAAQRMAAAIHVSGREVAKTVLLRRNGGDEYVVAVLPANRIIDLRRAAEALDADAVQLATEIEIAQHCPDCEMGALPPFGSRYGLKTLVDESLAEDEEIVFEGDNHHESIRMKFADFCRAEQPRFGQFGKVP
jgi:Ala-tRNA(Pro) deacylase